MKNNPGENKPGLTFQAALFLQKTQNFPPPVVIPILDVLLLLMGEQPIRYPHL